MSARDGGPAFPSITQDMGSGISTVITGGGMTLRDYFAGQALASGAISLAQVHASSPQEAMAILVESCYEIADAMLRERAR